MIVSFAVFFLLALVPGDPAITLAGGVTATPAQIAHVTAESTSTTRCSSSTAAGSSTRCTATSAPPSRPASRAQQIEQRFPVTFGSRRGLAIVSLVVGIPVGLVSGIRSRGGRRRRPHVHHLGLAVPSFWLAVFLVSIFAVHWHVVPPTGYTSITASFTGWLRDITLPAITLGVLVGATLARQLRASLIDTLDTPYIRTAWAKGGTRRVGPVPATGSRTPPCRWSRSSASRSGTCSAAR